MANIPKGSIQTDFLLEHFTGKTNFPWNTLLETIILTFSKTRCFYLKCYMQIL